VGDRAAAGAVAWHGAGRGPQAPADDRWRRLDPALAAAAGALQTLAFVHTQAWWLPIATLAWLVARLSVATPGRAAWLGGLYGTGWLAAGVWWLFVSMHRYGAIPAPLAALAVLALAAFLGLYLAAVAAAAAFAALRRGRTSPAGGRHPGALSDALPGAPLFASPVALPGALPDAPPGALPDALLFAALWLLAELARGTFFTGFPWLASGYAQVDSPLAALAPWIGVYGIGAIVAFGAAALAALWRSRGSAWGPAATWLVLLAAVPLLGPGEHTLSAGRLAVTLVQTHVAQDEKFDAERLPRNLAQVQRALLEAPPGLVVVPETAVPLLPAQLDELMPGYWSGLRAHFAQPGRAALVGLPLGDFESGYTNSVAGLTGGGAPYRYDKHHLVPFGEFIPRGFRWFTDAMNIPLGDFARGVAVPPSFAFAGQRIAPNICYEDLFGEELARRFADATTAPTVMANLSNIGWFGRTVAVPQHLNLTRLRSLEFQRPMLRATNTGATAIVDHAGRVQAMLAPHKRGQLEGEVEGRQGRTPYAAWAARLGHLPLWLAASAILLAAAAPNRRAWRRRRGGP
jgi:apolipoprotein N-acyltransferase